MYKQHKNLDGVLDDKTIIRTADNAFIPMDPDNRDYAKYLAWLAEGNVPLPADAPTE